MTKQQYDRARELADQWKQRAKALLEPQDYPGLDAAGFLLIALGHLVKAKEKLDQEPPSRETYKARRSTRVATNCVRHALKLLDEQKDQGSS